MKRIIAAIAFGNAVIISSAHASVLNFEEPETVVACTSSPCWNNYDIGGFKIRGHIADFGQNLDNTASLSNGYGGRMLASLPRALIVHRVVDGPTQVGRADGADFYLRSLFFGAAATDPFGASLFIDGYRDGFLLYHLQTPASHL